MADFARSTHPGVAAQLARLAAISPSGDRLGLERITALLSRLGDPHLHLPPVFHVAGTNGKGSTCAFLRAALEADGRTVHVFTSPHLVRFNERIRVAGRLIGDDQLEALLSEVNDHAAGIEPSFFEVTAAAAFLAFARTPADACVIEVGLGGRLDATNVVPDPAVAGIAALGLDHQEWLGPKLMHIAREKAGIAKKGRPLVTMDYEPSATLAIEKVAEAAGAHLLMHGRAWGGRALPQWLEYWDETSRRLSPHTRQEERFSPPSALAGKHQYRNYLLAIAMLRHQDRVPVRTESLDMAGKLARWPARMQQLGSGPLRDLLPPSAELWLDGGHNESAARALAGWLARDALQGRPCSLVLGMLANKDADGFIARLAPHLRALVAVPVPGHDHHAPAALAALGARHGIADCATAPGPAAAVRMIAERGAGELTLIAGSLYLAGEVLALNDEVPD
ncbi:folylpolyglutamate synthase/dihydrofolate synthase family protein [Sphingomonas sp. LHG3406-1]|uniref:bifunctional folylpolyglutamate synthase/dihydrofolate synthase n=1 Tax=Sphingomonas sp. LHG3406-1 TaxID=2804617 RepID=UPI002633BFD7|nr:folylpolyglutamate synthase/dihydrofolate synthase family protein [Sphingomonas sp. LHG3406-1]